MIARNITCLQGTLKKLVINLVMYEVVVDLTDRNKLFKTPTIRTSNKLKKLMSVGQILSTRQSVIILIFREHQEKATSGKRVLSVFSVS